MPFTRNVMGRIKMDQCSLQSQKLEDEPRSDRPTAISFDELKNLTEQHPYEGVRYFAASFGCSLSTVSNGLRSLGMVKKLGQWLSYALSDGNRQRRLDICTQLLSRIRRFDWLDTIVTGDGKWVLYVNNIHKRACCAGDEMPDPFVKSEIHEKGHAERLVGSSWNLLFRTAAGQHDSYCRGLLRSTAKTGRQDLQSDPSTRSSTTFACCTITRALTSRRLPREFWSSDEKFYRTHRTVQTCLFSSSRE
ncbi:hypothetical protein RB195_008050 [Necator americanus]|uniref:Transposase n=1 Tax=Necator americanus TaxID=51031 RepID=A0ABR1C0A4_NECAM